MDEEANDDLKFTLEYMTNQQQIRAARLFFIDNLKKYSDLTKDEITEIDWYLVTKTEPLFQDEYCSVDTSQELKDQIKMATMECSKGIILNQLASLGTSMPE